MTLPARTPAAQTQVPPTPTRADVTVVVVTYRGARWLPACLESLAAQTRPHELLVVDNNSTDGTQEYLAGLLAPEQVLRLPTNTGFAGGIASAMPQVATRFVALLNDDAVADPDWLTQLMEVAQSDAGAAAWTSLMVLADRPDRVNNLGATLNREWYGVDAAAGEPVDRIDPRIADIFGFCGGAVLLRTAAVRAVGGFPASYFMYYEDLDTSWRLRLAGWHIRAVPAARVSHRHAATADRKSVMFHFHNERNRLLTLLRCAPSAVALAQIVRFGVTTASLAGRRAIGRAVPDEANFRLEVRLRVLASVVRRLPSTVVNRPSPAADRRGVARMAHQDT